MINRRLNRQGDRTRQGDRPAGCHRTATVNSCQCIPASTYLATLAAVLVRVEGKGDGETEVGAGVPDHIKLQRVGLQDQRVCGQRMGCVRERVSQRVGGRTIAWDSVCCACA
jgi:hypothetical protein